MTIQPIIESGKPTPAGLGGHGRPAIYPFANMEVGDSFALPNSDARTEEGTSTVQRRLSCAAYQWAKRNAPGAKFGTKKLPENGQEVIRIWRIK